jgi:hypothetical protein
MARVLLLIAAGVAIGRPAAATLGDKGQIVPEGGISFNASVPTPGENGSNSYSVSVSPTLLYFVADRWAFGATVAIGYFTTGDVHQFSLGVGPTAAYALPMSERTSLFPQLTVFGSRVAVTSPIIVPGAVFTRDDTLWVLSVSGFVPLLFHPVEHVSLGFGPIVQADLAATDILAQRVRLGVSSTIGVYF